MFENSIKVNGLTEELNFPFEKTVTYESEFHDRDGFEFLLNLRFLDQVFKLMGKEEQVNFTLDISGSQVNFDVILGDLDFFKKNEGKREVVYEDVRKLAPLGDGLLRHEHRWLKGGKEFDAALANFLNDEEKNNSNFKVLNFSDAFVLMDYQPYSNLKDSERMSDPLFDLKVRSFESIYSVKNLIEDWKVHCCLFSVNKSYLDRGMLLKSFEDLNGIDFEGARHLKIFRNLSHLYLGKKEMISPLYNVGKYFKKEKENTLKIINNSR